MADAPRTAVVTGASRGLGAGLAARFARSGVRVALCARSDPADWAGPERGELARSVDVTDAGAVEAFCAEAVAVLGGIDLWVNNAGLLEPIGPLRDADPAAVATLTDVNLLGVVHGSQAFIRHRRRVGGGGVLVNISSGAGRKAYAGWAAYCASKAGVEALTACIALEEAAIGLRAHAVAPGVVDTDMQAAIRATSADRFPSVERFRAMKEHDEFFTTDHVADWLLALAFDPSADTDDVVQRVPPPV